jgi:hypothetical protein
MFQTIFQVVILHLQDKREDRKEMQQDLDSYRFNALWGRKRSELWIKIKNICDKIC